MEPMALYWNLMDSLRGLSGQMERRVTPFCTERGITTLQLSILMALYYEGSQTVSGLSKRMGMASTNSSALCKKLENEHYLLRQRTSRDERQVLVSLAPKGNDLVVQFSGLCKAHPCCMDKESAEKRLSLLLVELQALLSMMEGIKEDQAE